MSLCNDVGVSFGNNKVYILHPKL